MRLRYWTAAVSVCLYAVSLALPTYSGFNPNIGSGADAFLIGWHALTMWEPKDIDFWMFSAAWLANPATWLAVIAIGLGRWRIAWVLAALALFLGLPLRLRWHQMVAPYPGIWVWSASAVVVLVGSTMFEIKWLRVNRRGI